MRNMPEDTERIEFVMSNVTEGYKDELVSVSHQNVERSTDQRNSDIPSIDQRARVIFNDKSPRQMKLLLREFLTDTGLESDRHVFNQAMYLAQHPQAFAKGRRPELDWYKKGEREFVAPDYACDLDLSDRDKKMLELDASPVKPPAAERTSRLPRVVLPEFDKWQALPSPVKHIVFVCGLGAIVQGIDEAVVNGAQGLYLATFGIPIGNSPEVLQDHNAEKAGLINAAPYLCCVLSCWFTPLLNRFLGRRGTIFVCALFSTFFPLAQAFAQTWQQLVVYRLLMGIGIGPKSATIPIFAAEAAPANIRGSLVTFWQACTALGIAIGCASSTVLHQWGAFRNPRQCDFSELGNPSLLSLKCSWNWRVILLSPMVPPILLALVVYFCRESPRWTIAKAHRLFQQNQQRRARFCYQKAFSDLKALSRCDVLAARDMFIQFFFLRCEFNAKQIARDVPRRTWIGHKLRQLIFGKAARRNRRSIIASTVCMVAQQLCGVNVLIYYSNHVLSRVAESEIDGVSASVFSQRALLHTMGFGLVNFIFALPAFLLIDMMGRRTLLLSTFPFLAISHMIMACSPLLGGSHEQRMFLAGFYLFGIFYSPGEGPVPFVYASESMPISIREEGMGLVTSINWLLNWFVAFIAPYEFNSLGIGGTFALYGVFCVLLWVVILLLVPETRLLTLEQLDVVFSHRTSGDFAKHALASFKYRVHLSNKKPRSFYDKPDKTQSSLRRVPSIKADGILLPKNSNQPEAEEIEMVHPVTMHMQNGSDRTMTGNINDRL